eukprot:2518625-Amphidinium_carterae.1
MGGGHWSILSPHLDLCAARVPPRSQRAHAHGGSVKPPLGGAQMENLVPRSADHSDETFPTQFQPRRE